MRGVELLECYCECIFPLVLSPCRCVECVVWVCVSAGCFGVGGGFVCLCVFFPVCCMFLCGVWLWLGEWGWAVWRGGSLWGLFMHRFGGLSPPTTLLMAARGGLGML